MPTDGPYGTGSLRSRPALRMRSVRDGDTHVIRLTGELDVAATVGVEQELRRVEFRDARVVALDLSELTFIESTGIRLIIDAKRRLSQRGKRVIVVKGSRAIQRVFEICGVSDRLPFIDRLPSHSAAARSPATSRRASQATLAAAVRELRTRRRAGTLRY